MASYQNTIFVMGGYDGDIRLSTAEKYSTESNQWTSIASMHNARSMVSASQLNGKNGF